MTDRHSRETRSHIMSCIHSRSTGPEKMVRKYLFSRGLRYRTNDKRYPGKPDIVLPKYHAIVFVNGCLWHMHENCAGFSWPETNADFWRDKLESTRQRDIKAHEELEEMGWTVFVVWECELTKVRRDLTLKNLYSAITNTPCEDCRIKSSLH